MVQSMVLSTTARRQAIIEDVSLYAMLCKIGNAVLFSVCTITADLQLLPRHGLRHCSS